jgi:hypothetical protein
VQSVATHIIAAYASNTWATGPIDDILKAPLLRDTFACDWQQVAGVWMAA